jgi:hypothetical protein
MKDLKEAQAKLKKIIKKLKKAGLDKEINIDPEIYIGPSRTFDTTRDIVTLIRFELLAKFPNGSETLDKVRETLRGDIKKDPFYSR